MGQIEKMIYELQQNSEADEFVDMCYCGNNPITEEGHSCPFQEEIWQDSNTECNCCEDCTYQCALDI